MSSHSTNKAPLSSILLLLHQLLDPIIDSPPSPSSLTDDKDADDSLDLDDILNVLDGFAHVELLDEKITRIASQLLIQRQDSLGKGKGKARDEVSREEDVEKLNKLVNRRKGRNGRIGRRGLYFAFSMMLRQHFINSTFITTKSPYSPTLIPILRALLPHPSSLPSIPFSPEWETYLDSLSEEEQDRAIRWKKMVKGGDRLFLRCVRSGLEGGGLDGGDGDYGDDEEGTDEVEIMMIALEKMEDLLLQLDNHEIVSDDDFDTSRLPETPTIHLIATQILKFAHRTNRDKMILEGIVDRMTTTTTTAAAATQQGEKFIDLGHLGRRGSRIHENNGKSEIMVLVEEQIVGGSVGNVKVVKEEEVEVDELDELDELDEQSADRMMDNEAESSSEEHVNDDGTAVDDDPTVLRQQAIRQAMERMLAEPGTTWTVLSSGDIVKVDLTSLSRPSKSPIKKQPTPRKIVDIPTSSAARKHVDTPTSSSALAPAPAPAPALAPTPTPRFRKSIGPIRSTERIISIPPRRHQRPSLVAHSIPPTPPGNRPVKRRHTEGPLDVRHMKAVEEVEMLRGGAGDPIGRLLEREVDDDDDDDEGMGMGMGGDDDARVRVGNGERQRQRSRFSMGLPTLNTRPQPPPVGQGYERPTSTSTAKSQSRVNESMNKRIRPFDDTEVIRAYKKPRGG